MFMTLHPYGNIQENIAALHWRDLAKQFKIVRTTLDVLEGRVQDKWQNAPAVKAWKGYEPCLKHYHNQIREWLRQVQDIGISVPEFEVDLRNVVYPHWLGLYEVCHSHRNYLIKQRPKFYGKMWQIRKDAGTLFLPDTQKKKKNYDTWSVWNTTTTTPYILTTPARSV